ncbi:MAG TPA: Asp-tRNA(Asn)/Glu-tRNA(Gln) amidotransferase subunit GatC, partial [Negativicutes bacterium]|nr:Asp-tRNA(Asn)/Glu-tRNA(Gln) amidotransferase subunit GatC [Negativicutes bacterium]
YVLLRKVKRMKLTREDVLNVALLSRLEIRDDEIENVTRQFNDIMQHVDRLNQVNTENVRPTAHALPVCNVLRPDVRQTSLPREKAMANAPLAEDGFFRVPKIVEG